METREAQGSAGLPSQPLTLDADVIQATGWAWPLSHDDRRQLAAWEKDGIDRASTVIPVIRRLAEERANSNDPPKMLRYFDRAIRAEHAEDAKTLEYFREVHARYGPQSAAGGSGGR
jgi:hypothetical protein